MEIKQTGSSVKAPSATAASLSGTGVVGHFKQAAHLETESHQENASNEMLEAALKLGDKGLNVIALTPGQKTPLVKWKKYQSVRSTTAELTAWFTSNPKGNMAVVTGAVSNLLVLDVDGEEGRKSIEGLHLPTTWSVATPNGGAHYYFRPPDSLKGTTRQEILPCVDSRGEAGYAVLPPSVLRAEGTYAWIISPFEGAPCADAPQWLIELLQKSAPKVARPRDDSRITRALLTPVSAGERHDTLIMLAGYFIPAGEPTDIMDAILRNWNQTMCTPPIDELEFQKQIEDVSRRYEEEFGRCKNTPFKLTPKAVADRVRDESDIISVGKDIFAYKAGYYREAGHDLDKRILSWLPPHHQNERGVNDTRYILRVGCERKPEEINRSAKTLINVRNGLLNWATEELQPHTSEEFFTFQVPALYRPELGCGNVEQYLAGIFPEDSIHLVEEMIGYCLIPWTKHQKAFLLVGSGANGKSKFLNVMTAFFGSENTSAVSFHDLSTEKNRFKVKLLKNKLINIDDDLSLRNVTEANNFKSLVSGGLLTVEDKNISAFTLENHAKLLFAANRIPDCDDKSDGYIRRLVIIPMARRFVGATDDKNIVQKMTTEAMLSQWFNVALRGLKRLEANGAFSEGSSSIGAKESYIRDTNTAKRFLSEMTAVDPKASVAVGFLRRAYESYCGAERPMSPKSFNEEVRAWLKHDQSKIGTSMSWRGLTLNSNPTGPFVSGNQC